MPQRCLAVVFSTSHVICALSAFVTEFPGGGASLTVGVCDWPGAGDEVNAERLEAIRRMTGGFPFVAGVVPLRDGDFAQARYAPSLRACRERIRSLVGTAPDRIYFSHDCCGLTYQAVCAAYPSARRVCYGDGFGECATKEQYFKINHYHGLDPKTPLRNRLILMGYRLRRLGNRLSLALARPDWLADRLPPPALEHTYFRAHHLCLVLPTFYFSDSRCFPAMTIVPRLVALDILEKTGEAIGARAYEQRVRAAYGDRMKVLLATENLSEAGVIAFDDEIRMYITILEPYFDQRPVIIVKPHPGETRSRSEPLRALLGDRADIVDFDPALARMPLEIFTGLVRTSTIVSSGLLVITLKYLFDVDVVVDLTDQAIERYFFPSYHEFYKKVLKLTYDILGRLVAWDGRSVLYEGEP